MLHDSDDLNRHRIFDEANSTFEPLRIVHDIKNSRFLLLFLKESKVEARGISAEHFKVKYASIFERLRPWMQEFFGLSALFPFIFSDGAYRKSNIKLLDDLAKGYRKFTRENMREHFSSTQENCLQLESLSPTLFKQWNNSRDFDLAGVKQFHHLLDIVRSRLKVDI